MAIYKTIDTTTLSKQNEIDLTSDLPELVHLDDSARTVFIDFSKATPATVSPSTTIDEAMHDLKVLHLQLLLVEDKGTIIGLISHEDIRSERPLRIMQEKGLSRDEITVEMLMKPRSSILVIDTNNIRNAKVGHLLNTLKDNSANYILVVRKLKGDKHLIKGVFSASQIGKQLHVDLSTIGTKIPDSIIDLHLERKS